MIRPLILLVLGLAGCSGQIIKEVSGTVSVRERPAPDVILMFWPKSDPREPVGGTVTDAQGRYSVAPHDRADYWPEGTYIVQAIERDVFSKPGTRPKLGFPIVYWSQRTSPLEIDLSRGHNDLPDLDLSR